MNTLRRWMWPWMWPWTWQWMWQWMRRWRPALLCAVMLALAACRGPMAPPAGERWRSGALTQPISLEAIYWATPVVAFGPAADARPAEEVDEPDAGALIQAGAALYTMNCAPCHGENGAGYLKRFPALNRNASVLSPSPLPLIRTVLYGRGVMPAFDVTLTDREVAAVLSYIRSAWENDAAVINPAQVREVEPLPLNSNESTETAHSGANSISAPLQ